MKKAGKAFSCAWLFIHLLFNKRTVPLGENSSKRDYCIDGKHIMVNFDTTELTKIFIAGKTLHTQENYCLIAFRQVRITNDNIKQSLKIH